MYKRVTAPTPVLFTRIVNLEGDLVVNWNDEQYYRPGELAYEGDMLVVSKQNDLAAELSVFRHPATEKQYVRSVDVESNLL